ncbi:MAG: hypothetical protein JWN20_2532 [Jatrophihabitantaceae bacterium]|nr:hypothetical protein [Jatrophihabitantaceae bacterium]
MPADRTDHLVEVYLGELARAGIVLSPETAKTMLEHRMRTFANGLGLGSDAALAFYGVDVMRSWAREAAAQLRDEQPANPLLASVPERFAPVELLARCIEALIGPHPALAQRTAANLATYPAILLGGVAVVRCQRTDLVQLADVLSAHPDLSGQCSLLAGSPA